MAVMLGTASIVGCQSMPQHARLYSENRDKQGADAKAAWDKVDLDVMIATERGNLNKVLQSQLDLQEKYAINIRNGKLRAILTSDKKVGEALGGEISDDLVRLIGTGQSATTAATAISERMANVNLNLATHRFNSVQVRMPLCEELKYDQSDLKKPDDLVKALEGWQSGADANPRKFAVLASGVQSLIAACKTAADPYLPFAKLESGILRDALADKERDEQELTKVRSDGAALKKEFDASSAAYIKAIGGKKASDAPAAAPLPEAGTAECVIHATDKLTPTQVEVAEAGNRLCRAVQKIEKANNAFANKLLSEERLESLQHLVETVNQVKPGDPLPEDASRLTRSYILLPGLVDEVKAAIEAKKKPVAMSMLIQRNIDQLKLEAATREIGLLESRAKLSKYIVDEILTESGLLLKAKKNLGDNASLSGMAMDTAFSKAETNDKITLYSALTNYTDAIGRQEVKWRKARQERLATYHEIAVLYAEVNLRQWTSLIDTSVQQVGESAAGGVKSESFTNILNTLGLFYIGRGVRK